MAKTSRYGKSADCTSFLPALVLYALAVILCTGSWPAGASEPAAGSPPAEDTAAIEVERPAHLIFLEAVEQRSIELKAATEDAGEEIEVAEKALEAEKKAGDSHMASVAAVRAGITLGQIELDTVGEVAKEYAAMEHSAAEKAAEHRAAAQRAAQSAGRIRAEQQALKEQRGQIDEDNLSRADQREIERVWRRYESRVRQETVYLERLAAIEGEAEALAAGRAEGTMSLVEDLEDYEQKQRAEVMALRGLPVFSISTLVEGAREARESAGFLQHLLSSLPGRTALISRHIRAHPLRSIFWGALAVALLLAARAVRRMIKEKAAGLEGHDLSHFTIRFLPLGLRSLHGALIPVLAWAFLTAMVTAEGGLASPAAHLALVLIGILAAWVAGARTIDVILDPRAPAKRLFLCSDEAALFLRRRLKLLLAVSVAGAMSFGPIERILPRDGALYALLRYAFDVAVLLVIWITLNSRFIGELVLAREGRWQPRIKRALTATRLLVGLMVLIVAVLGALGYHNLAGFLLSSLLGTLAVLVAARFTYKLATDQLDRAVEPDAPAVKRAREKLDLNDAQIDRFRAFVERLAAIAFLLGTAIGLAMIWGIRADQLKKALRVFLVRIPIGEEGLSLLNMVAAVLIIMVFVKLSRTMGRLLSHRIFPRIEWDEGLENTITKLVRYALVIIGLLIAADMVGFDMSNVAIVAGAMGVGIGFGLQNVVNNFVSGIILLFERPLKEGDVIELGGVWGEVSRIRIRSTIVRMFDRSELIVPNADLISNTVTNWTHSDRHFRLILQVSVAYGSDVNLVKKLLLEMAEADKRVLLDPSPQVIFYEFGASSLDFKFRLWIGAFEDRHRVRSDINFAIDAAFREHGIEIPFPQRDLNLRDSEAVDRLVEAIGGREKKSD